MVAKKLTILFTFIALLFIGVSFISAQNTTQEGTNPSSGEGSDSSSGVAAPQIYPIPKDNSGFLGENHRYSVVFRGNGEAVVSARIILTNKGNEPLKEITLRIPGVEPKEVTTYQIIKEKTCIRYAPTPIIEQGGKLANPVCLEYQEPNYFYDYYGNSKYQRAKNELKIDTLKITLPQAIAVDKTGSYIIYFRTFGYARKNTFGAYAYKFETLKVEDEIQDLSIGISTDSDLFLKGVKGQVQYRIAESATKAMGSLSMDAPVANSAIDSFVTQIGQGSIIKTASNLAALESYSVKGSYASSRVRLYGKELMMTAVLIILLVLLTIFVIKVILKKVRKGLKVLEKDEVSEGTNAPSKNNWNFMMVFGASFLGAILITAYTGLIYLISQMMSYSGYYYQYQFIFGIFLLVISVGVYSVLLFAPAIYFGIKKGLGWGIGYLVICILLLILFAFIIFLIIFLFAKSGGRGGISPIVPLMEKGVTN